MVIFSFFNQHLIEKIKYRTDLTCTERSVPASLVEINSYISDFRS